VRNALGLTREDRRLQRPMSLIIMKASSSFSRPALCGWEKVREDPFANPRYHSGYKRTGASSSSAPHLGQVKWEGENATSAQMFKTPQWIQGKAE
jgi:hypothetical protein